MITSATHNAVAGYDQSLHLTRAQCD